MSDWEKELRELSDAAKENGKREMAYAVLRWIVANKQDVPPIVTDGILMQMSREMKDAADRAVLLAGIAGIVPR